MRISPLVIAGIAIALILAVLAALVVTGVLPFGDGGVSPTTTTSQPRSTDFDFGGIGIAFVFAALGFFIYCGFKESATTGFYKSYGVYGRIKAYLFTDLAFAAVISLVGLLLMPFGVFDDALDNALVTPISCIGCAIGAIVIFMITLPKCPPALRGRLMWDMIVSGCGVSMKFCLFFLGFVWDLIGPIQMVDSNGRTVYVYDGDVFDTGGNKVGHVNPDNPNEYVRYD